MRSAAFLLLAAFILLAACRNPDVVEEPYTTPPDTAVVQDEFYDPADTDPADRTGSAQTADETEARRTILGDVNTLEAQVIITGAVVRITAVLDEQGAGEAERKAEQFVTAAARQLERAPGATVNDDIGTTAYTYEVHLRDQGGDTIFEGVKPAGAAEITASGRPANAGQAPAGQ